MCESLFSVCYIDDNFSIIEGNEANIWNKITSFIDNMKEYYHSNKLKININKTQIMLSGNKNKIRGNINIDNNLIYNKSTIKILGTIFSEDQKFNNNVMIGSNNLMTQLKRRSCAIVRLSKFFDIDFKTQLIHSLLLGKIRFNIQTWGNTCLEIKNRINNIIFKTVERCTQNIWFGKTL